MNGRAEISRLRKRLDSTFGRIPSTTTDPEVQADYAKYLCILVSGFFENAIIALVLDFVERRSAPEITAYIERNLDHWSNPNTEKITTLLGAFRSDWRDELAAYLVDERKASINSLVALRHKIAHGESVGTSLSQVKDYYRVIREVVDHLAQLLVPP
jgi:RiboL-PSP-HEPN